VICLQGGHEFTRDCEEMDTEVLQRIGDGSVAVLAGAARVGSDYDSASARARRHYERLGAHVVIVPDPRTDLADAVAALDDTVALIVLPGGSPANLLEALDGTIGERLVALRHTGTAISGASAGAMVLCERTVRPGAATGTDVVDGLGLVGGLALPHWTASGPRSWPIPDDIDLWGLPECGGVIIADGAEPLAVGHGEPARRIAGTWTPIDR
jgi:cyanophycinase-like exopeptidase